MFLEVLHLGNQRRGSDLDQEVLEEGLYLLRGLVRGGDLNLDSSLAIIFEDLILLMLTNLTLRIVVSNPLSTFGVRTKIKLSHTIRGLDVKSGKFLIKTMLLLLKFILSMTRSKMVVLFQSFIFSPGQNVPC